MLPIRQGYITRLPTVWLSVPPLADRHDKIVFAVNDSNGVLDMKLQMLVGSSPKIGVLLVNIRALVHIATKYPSILRLHKLEDRSPCVFLVSDREDLANDNGESLFRYTISNFPSSVTYFVVRKKSSCGARLVAEGLGPLLVEPMSSRYWALLLTTRVIASSQTSMARHFQIVRNFITPTKKPLLVYLRHGVQVASKRAVEHERFFDLICCSNKIELDRARGPVLGRRNSDEVAILTGLARFSNYLPGGNDCQSSEILIAPTWRAGRLSWRWTYDAQMKEFERFWISLLPRISGLGYRTIYLQHPLARRSFSIEMTAACDELLNYSDPRVVEMISRARAFLTDYSSTAFDAIYAGTPTFFLRPDNDESFAKWHLSTNEGYDLVEQLGLHVCQSAVCITSHLDQTNCRKLSLENPRELSKSVFSEVPDDPVASIVKEINARL